ncbi:unnamed protein product [Nesidiocoris tenuis]|uniref:Uncharacterized protein n=1 Tax=Nesidiocoris tenuis TaxID=355587 RepID=A0A6H5G7W6_9HEMI|nr:unnamed protein product [Nesidiocoris tenuis]
MILTSANPTTFSPQRRRSSPLPNKSWIRKFRKHYFVSWLIVINHLQNDLVYDLPTPYNRSCPRRALPPSRRGSQLVRPCRSSLSVLNCCSKEPSKLAANALAGGTKGGLQYKPLPALQHQSHHIATPLITLHYIRLGSAQIRPQHQVTRELLSCYLHLPAPAPTRPPPSPPLQLEASLYWSNSGGCTSATGCRETP